MEIGRLYRAALSGQLEPATASRLVYMLREIRAWKQTRKLKGLQKSA
jgi:hypothetical protein